MAPRATQTEVEIVQTLNEAEWREFVERHPQSNIFHTPEMFHVFSRACQHRPELWAAVGRDGKLQALLTPVLVGLRHRLVGRLTTRAIAYGSVLCEPGATGERALQALLSAYSQAVAWRVLFIELRNLCDLHALAPVLTTCGFVSEEHLDYLIDLNQSPEELLKSIGPRTRKKIRQGLRRGNLRVSEVKEKADVRRCYGLIRQSYATAGVPLADPSLFDAAFEILYPRGMCKFWLATVDGADVAASVELAYKDTVYGWYGGIDRRYSEHLPGELLMWHILNWGIENGYRVYDFGGAGRPGEKYGVRDFKAKFGGRLVAYGRYRLVPQPLRWKFFQTGYGLYRKAVALHGRLRSPVDIPG